MKITCQACQSKYTIADDKIYGKVAKIRCRKCGATVLVDASLGAAAPSNGSGNASAAGVGSWLVSVAEGDERTMLLQEVLDAYGTGIITGDTYVWKEGMADWQALSEVTEIVSALNDGGGTASTAASVEKNEYRAPSQSYGAAGGYAAAATAGAARRDAGRAGGDLFGRGPAEEEVATSAPPQMLARAAAHTFGGAQNPAVAHSSNAALGTRDEQSVLFSLNALTGASKSIAPSMPSSPPSQTRNEDSGLIDLNALAKAQQARPAEDAALPFAAATPFMFPAALGTIETAQSKAQGRSSMPLFIGGGVLVAAIAIGIAIFAGDKKEEIPPMAPGAALSAVSPPVEIPAATVAAPEPSTADSAAAAASTPVKVVKKAAGGGRAAPKPAAGGVAAPVTPAAPALPPPKPKSPCGCSPGDLQCQIRCSATGH